MLDLVKKLSPFKRMQRHRQGLRFFGATSAAVGGLLFVASVPLVLDPAATISVDHIPTSALGTKLGFAFFAAGFFVLGVFLLKAPPRVLDRFYVWRQSARHAVFGGGGA